MFGFLRNWLDGRVIQRSSVTAMEWESAFRSLPLLEGASSDEQQRLRKLVILFMHRKTFEGAHGLVVTRAMKLIIGLQACLPVLNLGLCVYEGWHSVIVYPSGFAPRRVVHDEYGVEHHVQSDLAGEAWHRGPVILAWDEAEQAGVIDGHNLVIHEFAHKLDMLNGSANGFPPLHKGMDAGIWAEVFSSAYKDFCRSCDAGEDIGIDYYASSSPAEFFAVLSEVFFERPRLLRRRYAAVYEQLRQYYRQDPSARLLSQALDS